MLFTIFILFLFIIFYFFKAKKSKHLLYYLKHSDMDATTQACIICIKRNVIITQRFCRAMQITEILFSL